MRREPLRRGRQVDARRLKRAGRKVAVDRRLQRGRQGTVEICRRIGHADVAQRLGQPVEAGHGGIGVILVQRALHMGGEFDGLVQAGPPVFLQVGMVQRGAVVDQRDVHRLRAVQQRRPGSAWLVGVGAGGGDRANPFKVPQEMDAASVGLGHSCILQFHSCKAARMAERQTYIKYGATCRASISPASVSDG